MHNFKGILIGFVLLILFSIPSCDSEKFPDCIEHSTTACLDDAAKANLRIVNTSSYDYCNVLVELNNQIVYYGNVGSGDATCYISFDSLYRYAYIELSIEGNPFVVQPIDFIGESPVAPGYYSYKITVPDDEGDIYNVNLEFE
jgi:hypothetical protein